MAKNKAGILIQLGITKQPNQELTPITKIRFIPAQVKAFPDERPDACKRCGSQILARSGTEDKSVTDLYIEKVTTVRYRRSDCESAFRHCPEGGDRGGQTRRMRGCADARRSRGRSVCRAALIEPRAAAFGVSVSRMSVWRDA